MAAPRPDFRQGTRSSASVGEDLNAQSVRQLGEVCALAVSVRGALMADAHVGNGLPGRGTLPAKRAMIRFADGVDNACRTRISVLDLPLSWMELNGQKLAHALEREIRYGVSAEFKSRREHAVMEAEWNGGPVTRHGRDKAWAQLGTGGSGNPVVELGRLAAPSGASDWRPTPSQRS
jgi:tRNA-splicing ligase RtcB (3'-phosphate/5'-hydroxy nucleic acid ligase)